MSAYNPYSNLFYAERNVYLTGFGLFLALYDTRDAHAMSLTIS